MKNIKGDIKDSSFRLVKATTALNNISYLKQSLASAFGPNGRLKVIGSYQHNDLQCGSSSTLLLNSALVDCDDEIIKLLVSCAKEHLKLHYDNGLYCALLSLSLVESAFNLEISPCLVSKCFRHFLKIIYSHLHNHKSCAILKKIDISKANTLLKLIIDVFKSKPCVFFDKSYENLAISFLKAFLTCLPNRLSTSKIIWPTVLFLSETRQDECIMFDGLLLELYHYCKDDVDKLFKNSSGNSNVFALLMNVSFTISNFSKLNSNTAVMVTQSCKESIFEKMEVFAKHLLAHDITVLINQKVISEEIKYIFQKQSIVVIDRIGLKQMNTLKLILTTKVISSLMEDLNKCKTFINKMAIKTVKNKSFVQIHSSEANHCTLVLCYANALTIIDLKHVCWAVMNMLDRTFRNEIVIEGGSKFESYIVSFLVSNLKCSKVFCDTHLCSSAQFNASVECFKSCLFFLKDLRKTCDVVETVLDCYESKVNAFSVAVEAACIALEVKYQVQFN